MDLQGDVKIERSRSQRAGGSRCTFAAHAQTATLTGQGHRSRRHHRNRTPHGSSSLNHRRHLAPKAACAPPIFAQRQLPSNSRRARQHHLRHLQGKLEDRPRPVHRPRAPVAGRFGAGGGLDRTCFATARIAERRRKRSRCLSRKRRARRAAGQHAASDPRRKSSLWHVSAGTLTYNDVENRAHLEKNVVVQSRRPKNPRRRDGSVLHARAAPQTNFRRAQSPAQHRRPTDQPRRRNRRRHRGAGRAAKPLPSAANTPRRTENS